MPNGVMAPPPLMQNPAPARPRLFPRLRRDRGEPPPPPPPGTTGLTPRGRKPKCDECYTAEAQYEVAVDMSLAQYLYFCAHHMRKRWSDFVSRHYVIRKL